MCRAGRWWGYSRCGRPATGAIAVSALPIEYFAVGDSVASGYGLGDDATACRQSMLAYPWLVCEQLKRPLSCHSSISGVLGHHDGDSRGQVSRP